MHKLFRFFCLNPLSRWSTNQMSHEHTRYRIVTERSNLISVFSQMLPCDRIAVEMNEEVFLCYFFAAPLIHAISIEHSVSLNESLCVCAVCIKFAHLRMRQKVPFCVIIHPKFCQCIKFDRSISDTHFWCRYLIAGLKEPRTQTLLHI